MPYGLYLSASGANAQSQRLEVLSHNLANINTPGFKPHLAVMRSRPAEAVEEGMINAGQGGVDDVGGGVLVQSSMTQFTQGPMRSTGNRTDFAINDEQSFFVVQRGDKQLLTRAGNFSFDGGGRLVTPVGEPVMSTNGSPVMINPQLPYEVMDDGTIVQAGNRQMLALARPREAGDLSRVGDNLYQSLSETTQVPPTERQVRSGHLEQSAVQPTGAMMELIEASRVYEANVRMIQTQDQTIGSLIGRILSE